MARSKNPPLNPYYLELLKNLVVYKLTSRVNSNLSLDERIRLSETIKSHSIDSLNKIFSEGKKRRQSFNKSNLNDLCKYIGYGSWDSFVLKEETQRGNSMNNKLFSHLSLEEKEIINKDILLKIFEVFFSAIWSNISNYFFVFLQKKHPEKNTMELSKVHDVLIQKLLLCIDNTIKQTVSIKTIFQIGENIESNSYYFRFIDLPLIFKNEFDSLLNNQYTEEDDIDFLIQGINDHCERIISQAYKKGYSDEEIYDYLKFRGYNLSVDEIKIIKQRSLKSIIEKLKPQ